MAKINVGAATESEMKEKKARVEDALHATRGRVEEGILPGGGVALLRAAQRSKPASDLTDDEKVGYNIVVRACRSPIRQIAENAGQDGSVVANEVLAKRGQELRLQRRDRRVRRPGQGRRHRPDQGHPHRPAKRRQRRHAAAHQRRPDRRKAEEGRQEGRGRRRLRRHVLRSVSASVSVRSERPGYSTKGNRAARL